MLCKLVNFRLHDKNLKKKKNKILFSNTHISSQPTCQYCREKGYAPYSGKAKICKKKFFYSLLRVKFLFKVTPNFIHFKLSIYLLLVLNENKKKRM